MEFSPEVQAILDRVKSGVDKPRSTPRPKSVKPVSRVGQGKGPRPNARKANWDFIKKLYVDENAKVSEIASRLGMSTSGVIHALKQMKVYEPGRDYSRRLEGVERHGNLKDKCHKGHDMADAYISRDAEGHVHRDCRQCVKDRRKAIRDSWTPEQWEEDRAKRRVIEARRRKKKRVRSPEQMEKRRAKDREAKKRKYWEDKNNG